MSLSSAFSPCSLSSPVGPSSCRAFIGAVNICHDLKKSMLKLDLLAGFTGEPVLVGSSVVDSARLPQGSVEGHAVTMSAESVMQSMGSGPASAQGHPITFSGGSIMSSGISQAAIEHRDVPLPQQAIRYHPLVISGSDETAAQALRGR